MRRLLPKKVANTLTDDSYANCKNAKAYGWTAAHLVEEGISSPKTQASQYQISHLRELRQIYAQFFKSS